MVLVPDSFFCSWYGGTNLQSVSLSSSFGREPRGFGFVQYADPHDAAEAKHHMDGRVFLGRELTVVFAEENRKKPVDMRARERTATRQVLSFVSLLAWQGWFWVTWMLFIEQLFFYFSWDNLDGFWMSLFFFHLFLPVVFFLSSWVGAQWFELFCSEVNLNKIKRSDAFLDYTDFRICGKYGEVFHMPIMPWHDIRMFTGLVFLNL